MTVVSVVCVVQQGKITDSQFSHDSVLPKPIRSLRGRKQMKQNSVGVGLVEMEDKKMDIPSTMRAVLATATGEVDKVLKFATAVEVPRVKPGSGQVLIQVKACSLTPGDWRRLSGAASILKPPSMPYVPGLDVSGVVVEVDPKDSAAPFKVGDEIIGSWDSFGVGGFAEYALVSTKIATFKPKNISFIEGAAISNSPIYAMKGVEAANIAGGERVLILGGSGGVGTSLVQLLKLRGVSYIACTSTDEPLMTSLGVNKVINYREEDWTTNQEFLKTPFDVIFDCAEGTRAWNVAKKGEILKIGNQGGRFISFILKEWHIEFHNPLQGVTLLLPIFARGYHSRLFSWCYPKYRMMLSSVRTEHMRKIADLVEAGKFRPIIDQNSPLPFTLDGAKAAFNTIVNKAGHGKVVVKISD